MESSPLSDSALSGRLRRNCHRGGWGGGGGGRGCRWHMAPRGPAGLSLYRCSLPSSIRSLSMLPWLMLWWVHMGTGSPGLWSAVVYPRTSLGQNLVKGNTNLFNWKRGRVRHLEGLSIQSSVFIYSASPYQSSFLGTELLKN